MGSGTDVVVVMHDSDGQERTLEALSLDMSAGGAMIEAARAIDPGTLAWVDFEAYGTTAIAHVRRCAARDGRFRIGLRFSSPLMHSRGRRPKIHLVYSRRVV